MAPAIQAQLDALAARALPAPQLRRQLAALQSHPAEVGLFAVEHGIFDVAHARLSIALQRAPARCELAVGLARAKAGLGDVQSAIVLLDTATQLHPQDPHAARWSIQLPRDHGRLKGAAQRAAAVVRRQPGNGAAWRVSAPVFEKLGETEMALHAWRRAVELDPDRRWPWFHLGNLLIQQGRFGQAAEALAKAHALGPPQAAVLANLGTALVHAGRLGSAQNALQQAIDTDPNHLGARLTLAQVHASLTHEDHADAAFRAALARSPDHPRIHLRYAEFLISVGRTETAEQHLRTVLARKPDHPGAAIALGRLHTRRGQHSAAVARLAPFMQARLEAANAICDFARSCIRTGQPERALPLVQARSERRATPTQAQLLHHTLGELHEALGDVEAAFAAHQTGNRCRERDIDPGRIVADFEATAQALGHPVSPREGPGEGVVFIVGMLRSGTSLTEQILASHPQVQAGGELPSLSAVVRPLATDRTPGSWARALASMSPDQWDALGHAYIEDAARRAGTTPDALGPVLLTDKQPTNFMLLGAIARILPAARVLHCRRAPLDTCLSCFFQNFGPGHDYTTELAWMGRVYRAYRQQMAWWTEQCDIHTENIDYESIVSDTETTVRRLLDAVGLPFDPACLSFHENRRDVRTASVDQVRRPIYRSSVGRADAYAPWLGPLIEALGDLDDLPPLIPNVINPSSR